MLVLSRKVGQKIVVGDGVTITINRISGQRVSLGIVAPHGVRVVRSELPPLDHPSGTASGHVGFSDPNQISPSVSTSDLGHCPPR